MVQTIRKPNFLPFENQTTASLGCYMKKKLFYKTVQASSHSKSEQFCSDFEFSKNKMATLAQTVLYINIFFFFMYELVQASLVWFSNGWDQNRTTMNHPNTELVWYSSPHCMCVMMTEIQTIEGGQKDVSSLEGTKLKKAP